nr:hypothetical protein [uncultured organism]
MAHQSILGFSTTGRGTRDMEHRTAPHRRKVVVTVLGA